MDANWKQWEAMGSCVYEAPALVMYEFNRGQYRANTWPIHKGPWISHDFEFTVLDSTHDPIDDPVSPAL